MRVYELRRSPTGLEPVLVVRPDPEPQRGQVLVRMQAASLNYLDLKIRDGRFAEATSEGLVPLSDGAGDVIAAGSDVQRLKVGDRVATTFFPRWISGPLPADGRAVQPGATTDGALAELAVFEENALVPVPQGISPLAAATLPCAGVTAWQIFTGARRVLPGDVVLVQGSGGVALFTLQLALLAGARVIATTSKANNAERLKAIGAEAVINYRERPDWSTAVRELTDGRGADHILEIGEAGTLEQSIRAAAIGAQINLIGVPDRGAGLDAAALMRAQATYRRISVGSRSDFEALLRAIDAHHMEPVIDRTYSFEEATQAYADLAERRHFGKLVIKIA